MTTPEQPDEADGGPERTDRTAGVGRGHSAPRPVPPLTPAEPSPPASTSPEETAVVGSTDPDATAFTRPVGDDDATDRPRTDDATSDPAPTGGAPTRVSALGARSRDSREASGPAPASEDGASSESDDVATRTTPLVAPGPSGERTTALPVTTGDGDPAGPADTTPTERTSRFSRTGSTATPSRSDDATPERDVEATRVVPVSDPDPLAGSTNGSLRAGSREPLPDEEWAAAPVRRTAAHIWGVLGLLIAVPVTWFLLTDGALRTYYGLPPESPLNVAGLLSLAGGIVGLVVIALVTRVTSLGAWIWGGVVTAAGLAALVVPVAASDLVERVREPLASLHEGFGTNVTDYLSDTSRSGLLLALGLVLLLLAFVSHGARRSGRYEGRVKAEREARGL
ncbi:hypothetical protein [Litorihabitans aurantiacus]|uniref:Uncharacterized protein n=1 Tax=Litorihabitans aurantiacus TaxID=1930061 RepID=A0AA38CQX5_9MICO|nr:hypothetical protein [Litorihabitans aurantiacus]GMA32588.1 hypothetical protein GCM10025875_25800 [Litorihabitans aurantiacus]